MKNRLCHFLTVPLLFAAILMVCQPSRAYGQAPVTLDTAQMAYNAISQSLGLYVFPSKKQSSQKQKADEYECYKWAIQQSGIDPLNMPVVKVDTVQKGPDGTAVKASAKGAVVGLAIGSISGNAGQGAAIGAIAGGAGGMRQKRVGQAHQQQQNNANAAAQQQAILDSYKKAFSACIEGKGYTIK